MSRISRFLTGAFGAAALYYALGRILWPGDRTPTDAILPAVLFGLLLEAIYTQRVGLTKQGNEPYPPRFYFFAGLSGLGACVAFWAGFTPRPTGAELIGLLGGVALSLYVLACGFAIARRSRAQGVGSGT